MFDPVANRAAIAWMLQVGRAREFSVVFWAVLMRLLRNGIYFHQSFGPRPRRMRSPSFALVLVGGVLLFGLLALGLYLGGVIFSVVKEAWPHG